MAQSKKSSNTQKTTKGKTGGKAGSGAAGTRSKAASASGARAADSDKRRQEIIAEFEHKNPLRREIGAGVCFLLAIFCFIGFFNDNALFIGLFTKFLKGTLGYGFYVMPFSFLASGVILAFHRGHPVRLRVFCAILLSLVLGALIHVFARAESIKFDGLYFKRMWETGLAVKSGGVLSGSLAIVLTQFFSRFGGIFILVVLTILLILISINKTIADIADSYKKRPKKEYVYPEEPEKPAPPAVPSQPTQPVRQKPAPSDPQTRQRRRKKSDFDIPVDDVTPSVPAKTPVTPVTPPVPLEQPKRPAAPFYITGVESADGIEKRSIEPIGEEPVSGKRRSSTLADADEDIPLDIPFMETPIRQAPKPHHGGGRPFDAGHTAGETGKKAAAPVQSPLQAPEPLVPDVPEDPEPVRPAESAAPQNSTLSKTDIDTYLPEPETPPVGEKIEPMEIDTPAVDSTGYIFPPVELLTPNGMAALDSGYDEMLENSDRLESSFRSFGVNVKICDYTRGPAVTRYEAELEPGVKLSKITNLADDIALSIGASGVRIAAMPNKISTVGIEVPNAKISSVYLREIIESDNFKNASSKLTFAIGRSIAGDEIVGNISKLPHLLVAGTTGSGKSVCLNSMILSILYKAKPDEVRFIMVDPKMVEFKVYNGIPHLLIPVVTDAKKAAGALQWAVTEMLKRYRLFAETTARDLAGYNDYVRRLEDPDRPVLPQIVVFIDELADLMMVAKKEVEDSIVRIAQMGRAAGMHLVVATQSPRADVITGLMKANIPSRIALKVSNALESRIILDAGGNADKLVGNGDMLYSPIGSDKPLRIQGAWVSDEEREAVIDFVKKQGQTDYAQDVISQIENTLAQEEAPEQDSAGQSPADDYDELLPQAVEVVFESKQASSSMLQRRLKVGYTRAARLIDQMEELGIVGPFEGSKPRQLLISYQQWQEMQFINGTAPIGSGMPPKDDFENPDFIDESDE